MSRRRFEEGQTVVYYCNSEEYALQGSSILVCKSDGTWSRSLPNCIKTATGMVYIFCCCLVESNKLGPIIQIKSPNNLTNKLYFVLYLCEIEKGLFWSQIYEIEILMD